MSFTIHSHLVLFFILFNFILSGTIYANRNIIRFAFMMFAASIQALLLNGESTNEETVSYTHLTLPTIYSV